MAKLATFLHLTGNQGRETRWWCQISEWKWQCGSFRHVQCIRPLL